MTIEHAMDIADAPDDDAAAEVPTEPAPTRRPRRTLRVDPTHPISSGFLITIGVLLALAIGAAVVSVAGVLVSLVLALFIALGLDPAVRWLERRRMPRGWAIALVLIAFLAVAGVVLGVVVPRVIAEVIALSQSIPDVMRDLTQTAWFQTATSTLGTDAETVATAVAGFLSDPANLLALSGGLLNAASGIIGGLSSTIVVLALTIYFLASLEAMKHTFYRFAPAYVRPTVRSLTETMTESMGGFVMTMVILGALNSSVVFVTFLLLGLPYPLLLGFVAFLVTLVPVVGSVLFWVIGTTFALFSDPVAALVFALVYLAYMQIESYVLTPRLMGRTIAVPGILVLVGALLGAALAGLLGALVAVPVTACITLIVRELALPRQDLVTVRPE